jgi:signal transduction histidine kinase
MLRRAPSLARRAAIVFASVYAAILLAVLALNAAASWIDRGKGNLRGPSQAIDYAAAELRQVDGRLRLPTDGRFADLAARNPSLWLIVIKDGRSYASGAVPQVAAQTVAELRSIVGVVTFRASGVDAPSDAVSLQQRESRLGPVLIAAGGVDPATLSAIEAIDMLLNPGVALMLAVIGAISLLAMLIAIPSFSRALRPITSEAGAIGVREPGRRLDPDKAPKELLPLVNGFNAALDRLEVELGRRKRFIADVAHELRTPLAVLSLRVESLASEDGKEELRRSLRGLTHHVSQMLDLERLSLSSEQRSGVDLVVTARDVVADLAPIAINRGYDLSLTAPDAPVIVTGDMHAISRALTNLIGNAIIHGGGAGEIMVIVGEDRAIEVVDEGPGVPAMLQRRLFEPFSRGGTDVEGSGLGLHIVREIMRSHDGEVRFVSSPRGATFRLSFPPASTFG